MNHQSPVTTFEDVLTPYFHGGYKWPCQNLSYKDFDKAIFVYDPNHRFSNDFGLKNLLPYHRKK